MIKEKKNGLHKKMCSLDVSSLVGAFGPLRTLQTPAACKPPLRELCSHSRKA